MPSIFDYNKPYLDQLGAILKSGGVAGLIGAGTSMACGYPGWTQFLNALEEPLRAKLSDEYLKALKQKDVRTRLDKMVEMLGDDYLDIFRETFRPREAGQRAPEWIRLLFDLNLRLLLTTNYTTELEEVSRFHPSTPLGENPAPVHWYKPAELDSAIRRTHGRLQLIYLHGRWDSSPRQRVDDHDIPWSHVVLGEASYKYAYEHPGRISTALGTICGSNTLLVVGASLNDEDIKQVLRRGRALIGPNATPHYVIAPIFSGELLELKADEWRTRFGLQAIFYEVHVAQDGSQDHGGLETLLRELVRRASQAMPPQNEELSSSISGRMPQPRIVHPLLRATDFQPRPLYQQPLEEFIQREPGGGVLALVGIGGSGKTAIVREALAAIQAKRLRTRLDGVFGWSFYDQPDAAAFLLGLAGYVSGQESLANCSEVQALTVIQRHCTPTTRLVLILDGLEKLQVERPDDLRVHGNLESPTIRRLLLWMAQDSIAVRAIVTTRFPLRDVEAEQVDGRVVTLDLDSLTRPQARALLRRRGVIHGTEFDLNFLLDHFGSHALTVDHLGGVISNYLEGDPTRFRELGNSPLTRFEAGQSGKRLSRVLKAYQGYLERDEPEVRATLERTVIFPRPIGVKLLAEVFLAPERAAQAGRLHGKSELDLRAYLRRLVELHFLREEKVRNEIVYSIHPALRDAVIESMGKERGTLASAAQESMERRLLSISGRPGMPPEDSSILDLVEDLIGFCLDSEQDDRAYELYRGRLGGYEGIGWKLGDYARGERIARRMLGGAQFRKGMTSARATLLVDLATALETLGRIVESLAIYRKELSSLNRDLPEDPARGVIAARGHAHVLFLAGNLGEASLVSEQAMQAAMVTNNEWLLRDAISIRAAIRGGRGKVTEALSDFAIARRWQNVAEGGDAPLYSLRGFHLQILLLQAGRTDEAFELAKEALVLNQQRKWRDSTIRSLLVIVEKLRHDRKLEEAFSQWESVHQQVLSTDYQELIAWSRLFGSKLLGDQNKQKDARIEAEEGLRLSQACGFGLMSIDFLLLLARFAIKEGDYTCAFALATQAHDLSVEIRCDYVWGELSAHEILALVHRSRGELLVASVHEKKTLALREQTTVTDAVLQPLLSRQPSPNGLFSIVGSNFAKFQRRSKQGEVKAMLMTVFVCFRAFLQEKDRYPASFAEAGVSLEPGSRYVYMISPQDTIGGDGSRNRQRLVQRAWELLQKMGIVPNARAQSFLVVAVTDFDSDKDFDVWSISDQDGTPYNILNRNP